MYKRVIRFFFFYSTVVVVKVTEEENSEFVVDADRDGCIIEFGLLLLLLLEVLDVEVEFE
jgi:hypothetical protein